MRTLTSISLFRRLLSVLAVWLTAGLIEAVCSTTYLEYDGLHTKFYARMGRFIFSPIILPDGLAWAVLPGGYNAWPGREACNAVMTILFLIGLAWQSWHTATCPDLHRFIRRFLGLAGALLLAALCVIWDWHWDDLHMQA